MIDIFEGIELQEINLELFEGISFDNLYDIDFNILIGENVDK